MWLHVLLKFARTQEGPERGLLDFAARAGAFFWTGAGAEDIVTYATLSELWKRTRGTCSIEGGYRRGRRTGWKVQQY